jgi:hypothetical protein
MQTRRWDLKPKAVIAIESLEGMSVTEICAEPHLICNTGAFRLGGRLSRGSLDDASEWVRYLGMFCRVV